MASTPRLVIGAAAGGPSEDVIQVACVPEVVPASWVGRFVVVEDVTRSEFPSASLLAQYAAWLQPGGTLRLRVPGVAQRDTAQLLRGGFVQPALEGQDTLVARKPEWDQTPQPLSFTSKKPAAAWRLDDDDLVEDEFKSRVPAAAVWKMDLADAELEDENALLADISTVERPSELVSAVGEEDCSTSKKACRNCVCGRGSAEAVQGAVAKQQSLVESGVAEKQGDKLVVDTGKLSQGAGGCGSCALGDAFRCPGCPSRGLPAYSVGEKIVIGLE